MWRSESSHSYFPRFAAEILCCTESSGDGARESDDEEDEEEEDDDDDGELSCRRRLNYKY